MRHGIALPCTLLIFEFQETTLPLSCSRWPQVELVDNMKYKCINYVYILHRLKLSSCKQIKALFGVSNHDITRRLYVCYFWQHHSARQTLKP